MKKFLITLGVLCAFSTVTKAQPLESDLRSKTIVLHSSWTVAAGISTNTVLVSLSSTTVWPNPTLETGYVNVNNLYIATDKLETSSVTVKVGVVTYIDSSTGSVKYFASMSAINPSTTTVRTLFYQSDNSFKSLKVIPATPNTGLDGITPYFISNDILSGSTLFQTDVMLPAVNGRNSGMIFTSTGTVGNVFPGLGDIILSINNMDATNAIAVLLDMTYHYEAR